MSKVIKNRCSQYDIASYFVPSLSFNEPPNENVLHKNHHIDEGKKTKESSILMRHSKQFWNLKAQSERHYPWY